MPTKPSETHRADLEAMPCRAEFPVEIDYAALELGSAGGEGERKIRGVANTFRVMSSGRIIHPSAAVQFLKANPNAQVPLLAQHGEVRDFATIGKVTKLAVDPKRGLTFEALVATDTDLAEQAWALIQQRMLASVSIGWQSRQSRFVREGDADLDAHLAAEMKRAGVKEALAFLQINLLEISLVDVPDDAGARLGAKSRLEKLAERTTDTEEEDRLSALERRLDRLGRFVEDASVFENGSEEMQRAVASFHEFAAHDTATIESLKGSLNRFDEDRRERLQALSKLSLAERIKRLEVEADQLDELLDDMANHSGYAEALERAVRAEIDGCTFDGCSVHGPRAEERSGDAGSLESQLFEMIGR